MRRLLLLISLSWCALTLAAGPSREDWMRHREALLQDPGLVRYYTFTEVSAAAPTVKNLTAAEAPFTYGLAAASEEEKAPVLVPGRIAGQSAVRLSRAIYSAPPFPVENKTFSVEAWVRTHGQGGMPGDRPEQSATLLSQGNGYWDGWRLTLSYPAGTLGLEMGKRPGSFGIRAALSAPDKSWNHVVATWDGQQTRLYLNGQLIASGEYSGDYVAPGAGASFRLGFANAGWGSAVADFDEVAVYRRALAPIEILRHTLFHAPLAENMAAQVAAAEALPRTEPQTLTAYEALLKTPGLHPHWQAAFRLRMAQVQQQRQQLPQALRHYATVLETPDLPEPLQAQALSPLVQLALQAGDVPPAVFELVMKRLGDLSPDQQVRLKLNLARSRAQAGKTQEAARLYAEVLAMPDLKQRDKLEIMLQSGHSQAQAGQYAAARQQYEQLAAVAAAPPVFQAHAWLCVARCYLLEKKWAAARSTYRKVGAMAAAPEVFRWEAQDCLREVDRLEKQLPARDPAWSRVKLPATPAPAVQLYVSAKGSDTNPGTKSKPFATPSQAQQAVRALIAQGLPAGGVVVNLAAGTYPLAQGLLLTAADSGTAAAPIIYRAETPGQVILTGGRQITGFQPVTDQALLDRLPAAARGKVLQADLKAQGIGDFGQLKPRGFSHGGGTPALELFCDGQPLTPARWPNEGFVKVKKALSNDDQGAVFEYEDDRPSRWQQAKDPWVFGYWKWQWADSRDPITALVPAQKTLRIPKVSYGGLEAGAPYFVYNLLEEIDQPGEWYVDRDSGLLYLYPTTNPARSRLEVSLVGAPLMTLEQASHVRLEGLTLEFGQWHGVQITGGEGCLVAGCTIRNLSGDAVIIAGGRHHGVFGCELYNLGRGGTRVAGGDRKTLTPGGHFVENCDIHHFSRVDRTYTPAVLLDGCGNRIAHNRFHHTPCHAMRIEGNDHIIEFNEVFEVVRESDDQGGVDMWANPSYRGVVFRYNYFHDIGTSYPTPCGQAGIRLDDAISGILIYGNVFQRCSATHFGAIQLHGGKDDVIVNNVFADCQYGISFSSWGEKRWKEFLDSQWVQDKLHKEVAISQPPYSTRYPDLARLYEGEGIHQIWRNVALNCSAFLTRDRGIQDLMDNLVTMQNPGFAAPEKLDFTVPPHSALARLPGFRPLPLGEMGRYAHPLRAGK